MMDYLERWVKASGPFAFWSTLLSTLLYTAISFLYIYLSITSVGGLIFASLTSAACIFLAIAQTYVTSIGEDQELFNVNSAERRQRYSRIFLGIAVPSLALSCVAHAITCYASIVLLGSALGSSWIFIILGLVVSSTGFISNWVYTSFLIYRLWQRLQGKEKAPGVSDGDRVSFPKGFVPGVTEIKRDPNAVLVSSLPPGVVPGESYDNDEENDAQTSNCFSKFF